MNSKGKVMSSSMSGDRLLKDDFKNSLIEMTIAPSMQNTLFDRTLSIGR